MARRLARLMAIVVGAALSSGSGCAKPADGEAVDAEISELTFKNLAGRRDIGDTFAYWVCVLSDPASELVENPKTALSAMAVQYDAEEQGGLRGLEKYVPDVVRPVGPVALSRNWTPFAMAAEMLDKPISIRRRRDDVVLVFAPQARPAPVKAQTADQQHFVDLLTEANSRAAKAGKQILLCGRIGWSYDSDDWVAEDKTFHAEMRAFGFVKLCRRPAAHKK